MGEAGTDSGHELDCSLSEVSDSSGELLKLSQELGPRTGNSLDVRSTGLPFLPRPSLDGLPGAPAGSLSRYCLGTRMEQFSQTSGSESRLLLALLPPKLLSDEPRLGKYGL